MANGKILVTGGTGYIGSHTVVELQQKGYEVIIIDNLSNSNVDVVDNIQKITQVKPEFEVFDLCDYDRLHKFFNENNIESIIHFAAYKAVGESVQNPLMYYENNVLSLINLLKCVSEFSINSFVFSSSCTVYGEPEEFPVKETSPVGKAESPYGKTKQISEEILLDFSNSSSLNSILLRYFNPIGAHESALIGELPLGTPNNLVPYITQTAIGKREYLSIFGNDYDTKDGTCIRDYIHVVDIAKAHVIALERLLDNNYEASTEIYNLGTGIGYSVMDVVKMFEKISGDKLNYKFVDRRPGDITKVWADTSLSNDKLKWKAELGLEEMIDSAWKWELNINNK